MQTTTSLPIDPVDRQYALTDVVKIEAKFLEKLNQMSMIDTKKNIIHFNAHAWLIVNGYIPRAEDYTRIDGKPILDFRPGDFYMSSRHWAKDQEPFPRDIEYANMWGQDLKHDSKSWETTSELRTFNKKPKITRKIVTAIFEEASKCFDMAKFQSTDEGIYGALRRIQDVLQSIQRRIVAAESQIKEEIEKLIKKTPRNSSDIREMEIDMRDLVHIHERATRSALGSTEDHFCEKLIRHLIHAEAAANYENEATRSNIVRKLTDLMVARKEGHKYTIVVTWQAIARAYEEINGG